MSEVYNISAMTNKGQVFRLSSKAEVSLEVVTPKEEMKVEASQAKEIQKIEEGLKLAQEIHNQIEKAYYSLYSSEVK